MLSPKDNIEGKCIMINELLSISMVIKYTKYTNVDNSPSQKQARLSVYIVCQGAWLVKLRGNACDINLFMTENIRKVHMFLFMFSLLLKYRSRFGWIKEIVIKIKQWCMISLFQEVPIKYKNNATCMIGIESCQLKWMK